MFGSFVATRKSKEDLQPDLRKVAREISLKTQVYVTPEELKEITELIPDGDVEEQVNLDELDSDINDDDVSQRPLDVVEESYSYFYAQTDTTTVLCQVVMDTDEHVRYNVKKIEW